MRQTVLLTVAAFYLFACSTELPHEAAFDPNSPLSKQAPGEVAGTVTLEGETDHSQVTVQLQNGARTYSVDTDALGQVKLTGVVPGEYRLSIRTRYFEPVSQTVRVSLGQGLDIGAHTLPALRTAVLGSALVERLDGASTVTRGGVTVRLRKTASIRSGATGSPAYEATAETTGSVTKVYSTVSNSDGEFQIEDVSAGRYTVLASTSESAETTVGEVTVTGESVASVGEVVLRPLSGYFSVVGYADGVANARYSNAPVRLFFNAVNPLQLRLGASASGGAADCELGAKQPFVSVVDGYSDLVEGENHLCASFIGENGDETDPFVASIVYDVTAPNPVFIEARTHNGYVSTDYVLMNLTAIDAHSGVAKLLVTDGTSPELPETFQATKQLPLGSDGVYKRWISVIDAAGNATAPFALTVTVDTQAPAFAAGPFLINGGMEVTSEVLVTLAFNITDATEVRVSQDAGFGDANWAPYALSRSFQLTLGDGDKRVYAQFRDGADNRTSVLDQTITLDTKVPSSPYVDIQKSVTSSTTVQVSLGAAYVDEMILSENADFSGANWQAVAPTTSYTFTVADGTKTLHAKFRKTSGLETSVVTDTYILDSAGPSYGSVSISGGAAYASSTNLPLQLSAVDETSGVRNMMLSQTADFSGAVEQQYQMGLVFPFAAGEGTKRIYVKYGDRAGNYGSAVSDYIAVDLNAPAVNFFRAEDASGNPVTAVNTTSIRLHLDAVDTMTPLQMRLSNNAGYTGAAWETYSPTRTWEISAPSNANGENKLIYAQVRDAVGHVEDVGPLLIFVDTQGPTGGSLILAGGAELTNDAEVDVALAATGADWVELSQDSAFSSKVRFVMQAATTYTFTGPDGLRTLYARFQDTAGNWSATLADTVEIDRSPPELPSLSIGSLTNDRNVTLQLSAVGAYELAVTDGTSCGTDWEAFKTSKSWTLPAGDGEKWVSVVYRDEAGNPTNCVSDSIELDETAPVVNAALIINDGDTLTNDARVMVTHDVSDAQEMQVSENLSFSGASWQPYTTSTTRFLSEADALKTIYARYRDGAGNVSLTDSGTITLDATPPTDLSISLAGGTNLTNQTEIGVGAAATGADYVRVANSSSFSGASWLPYSASITNHPIASGDGLKTVYAQFKDEAGNLSAVVSDTIVKDTQAPTDVSLSIAEAPLANKSTVMAVLSAAGANEVQLSGDIVGGSTGWISNRTSVSVGLSAGDATKEVTAQWRDLAGNLSAIKSASVTLDQAPPTDGSVAINASELTNNPNVTLNLTYGGDAVEMMISNASGFVGAAWEPVAATVPWTLSSGDGTKTVYVKYRDEAGNASNAINDTIVLDTTPPTSASFTIVEETTTGNTRINLSLSAVGATEFWSANTPDFSDGAWRAYAAGATHDVPTGDGLKVVYVKFRDAAANESSTLSQVIALDTGAPTGPQLVINAGAVYTKDATVTLSLNAADAATMAFSNDGATFGAWEPFAPTKAYPMPGTDGTNTVWVKYRDAALNETAMVSDDIILDREAPTGMSIVVANGDAYTRTQTVILTLTATDATWMQVSQDNSFSGMGWEPFGGTKQFVLSNGQGPKTVYARFKDEAGWVTGFVSDGITFDSIAPGNNSLAINGGAAYTNVTEVTLAVNSNDATAEMRLSESSEFSGADWEPLAYTRAFTLSTGDGTKTVYMQLRDPAGNETGVLSRSISLDSQPPANAQVSINGDADFATANDGGVTLSLSANDAHSGVTMVRLSNTNVDGDLDGATAVAFTQTLSWTLEPNGAGLEGARTVYAKFVDGAGNETPVASTATIFYDTQAPTVGATPIAINGGSDYATSTFVELSFGATDAAQMMIGNEGVFTGAMWETYRSTLGWYLQSTQGERSVAVKFRDAAGNETAAYPASLTLDSQTPTTPSLSVSGGSGYVTSTTITLDLSAAGADYVQVSADGIFEAAPLEPYAASLPWTLSAGDGSKTIYVRFCDEAGNCTDTLATTVVLDTVAPTGSVAIANGAAYTRDITVNLSVSAADAGSGIDGLKLANTEAALATTNVVAYEATKVWTLGGASGASIEESKQVWMQVVDRAGWSSAPVSDTIVYDRLPPTGSIALVAPGGVTNQTLIGVDLSYSADTAWMKLSSGDACAGGNWVQASEETLWTLPSIDGTRWVSVRFRDSVLNESICYVASVVLDRTGPTPKTFVAKGNAGAKLGYSNTANLAITGSTLAVDCAYAELSEDVGFIAPTGTVASCNFSAESYTLANSVDGIHDVYLRYFDTLGNAGAVTKATMVLDTSPPSIAVSGAVVIEEGPFTNQADVVVRMQAGGVDWMTVTQGAACGASWIPFSTEYPTSLTGGDGAKEIHVRFKDDAGSQTPCYSATVTLDTFINTAWSILLTGKDGRTGATSSQGVTVEASGIDLIDIVTMRVSNIAGLLDADWVPIDSTFDWTLNGGDGLKTVYLELGDRAGNKALRWASISLDQTAPDAPALQIDDVDGDGYAVAETEVELRWTLAADATSSQLEVFVLGMDVAFRRIATDPAPTVTHALEVEHPGYAHQFRVRAVDAVGNVSQWSAIPTAYPFTPRRALPWFVRGGEFHVGFSPHRGVLENRPVHAWQDANGVEQSIDLPVNSTSWSVPVSDVATRFSGRLDLAARNLDTSLIYKSAFNLGMNSIEIIPVIGTFIKMEIDPTGRPVMFYSYDKSTYAYTLTDAGWAETASLTVTGIVTNERTVTFGPDGYLHAFLTRYPQGGSSYQLEYWRQTEGGWIMQDVLRTGVSWSTFQVDVVVDDMDVFHLLYVNTFDVRHFENSAGYWQEVTLVTSGGFVRDVALAKDASGTIAAFASDTSGIRNWELTGASWSTEYSAFTPSMPGDEQPSIDAFPFQDGWAVVSQGDDGSIFHFGQTTIWNEEFLNTDDNGQMTCAMDDSQGRVHVLFNKSSDAQVAYGVRSAGGEWAINVANGQTAAGAHCTVHVDETDRIRFGYGGTGSGLRYHEINSPAAFDEDVASVFRFDDTFFNPDGSAGVIARPGWVFTRYARTAPGDWSAVSTGPTNSNVSGLQATIEDNDDLHGAYVHQSGSIFQYQLHYIGESSGTWTTETIDSESNFLLYDIGLNTNNEPVVAYSNLYGDTHLATRVGVNSWDREIIHGRTSSCGTLMFPSGVTTFVFYDDGENQFARRLPGGWEITPFGASMGRCPAATFLQDDRYAVVSWARGNSSQPTVLWGHIRDASGMWTSTPIFSSDVFSGIDRADIVTLPDGTVAGIVSGADEIQLVRWADERWWLMPLPGATTGRMGWDGEYRLGYGFFNAVSNMARWEGLPVGTLFNDSIERIGLFE